MKMLGEYSYTALRKLLVPQTARTAGSGCLFDKELIWAVPGPSLICDAKSHARAVAPEVYTALSPLDGDTQPY